MTEAGPIVWSGQFHKQVRKSIIMRNTISRVATGLLMAMLASVSAPVDGAASASTVGVSYGPSWIGSNSGGANVRSCPNTGCTAYTWLPNGTSVTMLCWTDAQLVGPPNADYWSQRWFRIAGPGVVGYTHSSLVENQTSVGAC